MYPNQHIGDISRYPQGAYWPSGTWVDKWSPGHTRVRQDGMFTSPNLYKDRYLGEPMEGIFGDIWGGVKSVGGTIYGAGKAIVTSVPAAAVGFVTGGIPGAIAAGGASAVSKFLAKSPEEQERIRQQLAAEELENRVPAYQQQYPDSISNAATQVYNAARAELLARGGEAIARTPEGRAAISSTVQSDIWTGLKPALPFIAIGAAFMLLRK